MGFAGVFVGWFIILGNYKKKGIEMKKAVIISLVLSILLSLSACFGGGSSSSGKSWSDLSDVEKANAKWAYEVQQGLKR